MARPNLHPMLVLGLETSCDETGVALWDTGAGLRGHVLHTQIALHREYGGVVPELASRDHVRRTIPLVREVLAGAGATISDLDGVAYTAGPGLVGALLVGAGLGRSLAWALGVPAIGVHHMEGHLLAPLMEPRAPQPPFVALLVSGGHTMLIEVAAIGRYRLLGDTLDDAAGEAFDKTAKLMGLPYPGGPALAAAAADGRDGAFTFSRPMTDRPGLDFSFSGLKTQVLLAYREHADDPNVIADVARAFERAVADTLVTKCRRALAETGVRALVVAGGVGANRLLRQLLAEAAARDRFTLAFPRPEFCTDNGAMIAFAGALRLQAGLHDGLAVHVAPRWDLASLPPLDGEQGAGSGERQQPASSLPR